MNSKLDPYIIELESKIQILDVENATLSAKAEENLLLSRAFEEINDYDDIDNLFLNSLESISVLLNIQFSGLFDLIDKQLICKSSYALFSNKETLNIQLKVPETILKKLILNKVCVLNKTDAGFIFNYPGSDFVAEQAIIIPVNSEIVKSRFFVFIDDSSEQELAERIPLFEKINRIISAKLERIYYQNELIDLNAVLEKKINIRTEELQKQNAELVSERLRAEKSEMQARDILQTAMDGFWMVDIEGRFIQVNEIACKMLGYTRTEMLGMKISDIEEIESAEKVNERIEKITKNGEDRFESKHRCKHGEIIDVEVSVKSQPGHNMFVVFVRDITEHKHAEKELLEKNNRLLQSQKIARLGFLNWDINTNELFISDEVYKLFGLNKTGEFLAFESLMQVIHPDDVNFVGQNLEEGAKGIKPVNLDHRVIMPDGIVKWFHAEAELEKDKSGIPLNLRGVVQDITDRKYSEESLRESEERFHNAINDAPLPIMIHREGGIVEYINKKWVEITGYSIEEIPTIDLWTEKAYGIKKDETKKRIEKLYKIDKSVDEGEYILTTKSGKIQNLFFSSTSLGRNSEGKNIVISMALHLTERIRVLEELKESEERFRRAVLLAPNPIMIHNEDNQILQLSNGWTSYSGYAIEDIPTLGDWTQKAYGKKSELAKEYVDNLFEIKETANNGEWEIKSKNGDIRYWEFFTTPLGKFSDGKRVLLSTANDVTERRQGEKELIKLTTAVKQSANTIVITDIDGNIEYTNPKFTELTGYTAEEAKGLNPRILNAATQPKEYYAEMWKTISGGKTWKGEFHNKKKNGDLFWEQVTITPVKDKDGKIKNYLAVKEDITAKREAEQALKESEEKFRSMMQQSPSVIEIYNLNGLQIDVNKAYENLWGFSASTTVGKFNLLKSKEVESTGLLEYVKKAYSGETVNVPEYEFNPTGATEAKGKGRLRWLRTRMYPLKDTLGKVQNIVITHEDITIQKSAEQELIGALEKATESDRLKSAFLANMSHEIRTPMNGILGFSSLLKEPGLSGDEQQEYIGFIEESGARMLNIINDIVSISKIESGILDISLSETNINNQLEFVYNLLKLDAENKRLNLSFICALPEKEAVIYTDSEKFYGILTNLVKNAIKYTDTGTIEFGYEIVAMEHALSLQFYVKDTGIGILKDRQEAIFERFIQADIVDKMARQGAGLGLAITKAYVEMLDGKIWLESEPGKGSAFYFTIPYKTETLEKPNNKNEEVNAPIKNQVKNLKILIAEDDPSSEMLLSIAVSPFVKEIYKTTTGTETVETCRKNPDIDLVLMDIQMPGMNGYEATRKIREFNKNVVIIAQTAFALAGDREKAIDSGCNDYIGKPIKSKELLKMIGKYFN